MLWSDEASSLRTATNASSAKSQRPRIHLRGVALHDAARFELADALEHSRRRQPDRAGDIDLRLPGVGLELVEDLKVDGVEVSCSAHDRIILCLHGLPSVHYSVGRALAGNWMRRFG